MGLERPGQSSAATKLRIPATNHHNIITSCATQVDAQRYTKSHVCQGRLWPTNSSVSELLRRTSTPPGRAEFQPLLVIGHWHHSAFNLGRSCRASIRCNVAIYADPMTLPRHATISIILCAIWNIQARRSDECEGKHVGKYRVGRA